MSAQNDIRLSAALLAAAIALAACGGSGTARAAQDEPAATVDDAAAAPSSTAQLDPARYFGLYGDPEHPDEIRGMFFVTEAKPPPMADHFPEIPPGYVMISAAWADVAPYYMKPISETRFEQDWLSDFDPEPAVVEFELDNEGHAVALRFDTVLDEFGGRTRLGDVPEEYR